MEWTDKSTLVQRASSSSEWSYISSCNMRKTIELTRSGPADIAHRLLPRQQCMSEYGNEQKTLYSLVSDLCHAKNAVSTNKGSLYTRQVCYRQTAPNYLLRTYLRVTAYVFLPLHNRLYCFSLSDVSMAVHNVFACPRLSVVTESARLPTAIREQKRPSRDNLDSHALSLSRVALWSMIETVLTTKIDW